MENKEFKGFDETAAHCEKDALTMLAILAGVVFAAGIIGAIICFINQLISSGCILIGSAIIGAFLVVIFSQLWHANFLVHQEIANNLKDKKEE